MAARQPFSIKLPDAVRAEVERIAKNKRRSRNFIITEALEQYIIAQRREEAENDTPAFIPNDDVDQWVRNLRRTDG